VCKVAAKPSTIYWNRPYLWLSIYRFIINNSSHRHSYIPFIFGSRFIDS
jgi:hypothetical protein